MDTNDFELDDLRQSMRDAKLPQSARDRIQSAIKHERLEAATPQVKGAATPHANDKIVAFPEQAHAPRMARRFAVAAAVAMALVGTAGAFGASGILGSQNSFVLAAYAEGAEGTADNAVLAPATFAGPMSWAEGEYSAEDDMQGPNVTMFVDLDLSCAGDNIQKMVYSLDGETDGVALNYLPARDDPDATEAMKRGDSSTQLTIEGNGQTEESEGNNYQLGVTVPLEGKLAEASAAVNEGLPENSTSWNAEQKQTYLDRLNAYEKLIARAIADKLAGCKLTVTATFADGSKQTHVYQIDPVENFDALYEQHMTAFEKAVETENDFDGSELQPLFTIQQES